MDLFQVLLLVRIALNDYGCVVVSFQQKDNDNGEVYTDTRITIKNNGGKIYSVTYYDKLANDQPQTISLHRDFLRSYIIEVLRIDAVEGALNIDVNTQIWHEVANVGSLKIALTRDFWRD